MKERYSMKNIKIKDNTNELFLTTKIISTSALFMLIIALIKAFEYMVMNKLSFVQSNIVSEHFKYYYIVVVGLYFWYIMFQVINYRLSINKNYKLHSWLKIELILSIAFILVLFFIILKG